MRGKTSQSAGVQRPTELREQAWRSKWGLDLYLKNNGRLFKGISNRGNFILNSSTSPVNVHNLHLLGNFGFHQDSQIYYHKTAQQSLKIFKIASHFTVFLLSF